MSTFAIGVGEFVAVSVMFPCLQIVRTNFTTWSTCFYALSPKGSLVRSLVSGPVFADLVMTGPVTIIRTDDVFTVRNSGTD